MTLEEKIIRIDRLEKVRKKYERNIIIVFVLFFVIGALLLFGGFDESIVKQAGSWMMIIGMLMVFAVSVKPSLLRIGEFEYHKVTVTSEFEYKEYQKTMKEK